MILSSLLPNSSSTLFIFLKPSHVTISTFDLSFNNFNKAENHMVALSIKPGTNNYKLYQNAVVTMSQTKQSISLVFFKKKSYKFV